MTSIGYSYHLRRIKNHYALHGSHPSLDLISLEQDFVKFGRNPEQVDIVLHSSAYANMISREHAEIKRSKLPDGTVIFHLMDRSLNGTYVNDFRVAGQRLLQIGDVIQFGHINGAAIHPGECAPQPDAEFTYVFEKVPHHSSALGAKMASFLAASSAGRFSNAAAAAAAASKWTDNPYAFAASGAAAAQNAYLAAAAAGFNPAAAAAYHLQSALTAGQNVAAARQSPFGQSGYASGFRTTSADANTAVGGNWLVGVTQPASMGVLGGSYAAAAAAAQQRFRNLGPECTAASTSSAMANLPFQQTSGVIPGESNFRHEQPPQHKVNRNLRLSSSANGTANFSESQGYQKEQKQSCDIDYSSPSSQSLAADTRFSGNQYTGSIVQASNWRSFYEDQHPYTSNIEKHTSTFSDQNFSQTRVEQTTPSAYVLNSSPDPAPTSRSTVVMEAPVRTLADTSLQTQPQQTQEVYPGPRKAPVMSNESSNTTSSTILRSPDTTNTVGTNSVVQVTITCSETPLKSSLHTPTTSLSKMECDSSVPSPPASDSRKANEAEVYESVNDDETQAISRDIYSLASSLHSRCINRSDTPESDSILEVSITGTKEKLDLKTHQESSSPSHSETTSNERLDEKPPAESSESMEPLSTLKEKNSVVSDVPKKRKSNEVARLLDELSDSSFMFEMRKKEAQLRRKLGQVEQRNKKPNRNRKRQHSASDEDEDMEEDREDGSNKSTENSEYEVTDKDAKAGESDSGNELLSKLGEAIYKPSPRRSRRNITNMKPAASALSTTVERNLRSSPKGQRSSAAPSKAPQEKSTRRSPRRKAKVLPVASCSFLHGSTTSDSSNVSDQSENDEEIYSSTRSQKSAKPEAAVRSLRSSKLNAANKAARKDDISNSSRSKFSSKKKTVTTLAQRKRPVKSAAVYLEDRASLDKKADILPRDLFWSYHDPTVSCAADQSCLKPTDSEVQWVQCDKCSGWYHVDCVDCDYNAIKDSDAEFSCDKCKVVD